MIMIAYEVKTNTSDYPFLVVAKDISNVLELLRKRDIFEYDILRISRLGYKIDNIITNENV